MRFYQDNNKLIGRENYETLCIEPWGRNAVRVRSTINANIVPGDTALTEAVEKQGMITITEEFAQIVNGKLKVTVGNGGYIRFYKNNELVLNEYYRAFGKDNPHSPSMKLNAREYQSNSGGTYEITVRFDSDDNEMIYGMGQYQQPNLDLKGCILELAQRNSQISVPFAISSKGYGFLWNNGAVGKATFGANYTEWIGNVSDQIDYWFTADDTPKEIIYNYTQAVGRTPMMPENVMGLWQCKLRYRTQDEVLEVAREYHKRGLKIDVIVIDFFHWIHQGDWSFDPKYWPDPKAMVEELNSLGIRCMVSIWPTVDRASVNFLEMTDKGLLIRTERGSNQTFDFQGDTQIYDATNPEARKFIWDICKKNYYEYGIDMFWLDEAEPEYSKYDYDHYHYHLGPCSKVGNQYPMLHAKAFYDGMIEAGQDDVINLLRCAWVGSQKYAALVWSGDVFSNFESLRDQFAAGLNIGLAGIPWWVSDTGGFFGNVEDPWFNELLIRWFQFSTFCPVLRMHGDRGPHDIPNLEENTIGGGFSPTGRPNELWSYGEEVYEILLKYYHIRLEMKPYITAIMEEAHQTGAPVIRTMFFEFPDDIKCWEVKDQYMFGDKYLVAPILYEGMRERNVYLPNGNWKDTRTGIVTRGGIEILTPAPLDSMPVFEQV